MMFKVIFLTLAACVLVRANTDCISDCSGQANGDYHSCNGCNVYATCSNEILYDNRPCPADLLWDDDLKSCEYTSPLCNSIECVSSCNGKPNGDYQSCNGCGVYATCSNGNLYDNRPCPADLVWDNIKKRCESTSATCTK